MNHYLDRNLKNSSLLSMLLLGFSYLVIFFIFQPTGIHKIISVFYFIIYLCQKYQHQINNKLIIMLKESVRKTNGYTFQAYQSPDRPRIYTYAPGLSPAKLKTPTRERISSLEYNILMNNPAIDSQTLTSKLFHCTQQDQSCLFRFQQTNRKSKIVFRALCPNIYFQKLRIIYFLLLTQSYQPLYKNEGESSTKSQSLLSSINSTSSITLSQNYKSTDKYHTNRNQNENQFKKGLNILRQMFYEQASACKIKQKYLAQFFQFLEFDHQQYMRSQKQGEEQNIVVNIMNKYPIMDQIFIDMLIMFIEKSASKHGGMNIDDNFNIKQFLQSLSIEAVFISNWQFILETIRVTIGIDTFSLDYDSQSFFTDIVQTLDLNGTKNGLDVSNVGGFDQQVFKKLDASYIHDLNQVMSNCSQSRIQFEKHDYDYNQKIEEEKKSLKNQIDFDNQNKKIKKTASFYHPINIIKVENTNIVSQLTIGNMKKNNNARINNPNSENPGQKKNIGVVSKQEIQDKIFRVENSGHLQSEDRKIIGLGRNSKGEGMLEKIIKKPDTELVEVKKPIQMACLNKNNNVNSENKGQIKKNQTVKISSNIVEGTASANVYSINSISKIDTPNSSKNYQYLAYKNKPNPPQGLMEYKAQTQKTGKISSEEKNVYSKIKNQRNSIIADAKQVKKQTNPEQSSKDLLKNVNNIQNSITFEEQKKLYQRENQNLIYGLFKTDNTKSLPGNSLSSEIILSQDIKTPLKKTMQPKFKVYYETSGQSSEAFQNNEGQLGKVDKKTSIIQPVKIADLYRASKRQQIKQDSGKKEFSGTSSKQFKKMQENKKLINQLYQQFVVKKTLNGEAEQRKRLYSANINNNEDQLKIKSTQMTKENEKINSAIPITSIQSNPGSNNSQSEKNAEKDDKSINEVCNNINEMLSNIKIALQKNDKKLLNPIDLNNKTEGQQMWEKHKLKNSFDPKSLRGLEQKAQERSQILPSAIQLQTINATPPTRSINFQQRVISPINLNEKYRVVNNGSHIYTQNNVNSPNYGQNITVKSGVKFMNNDNIKQNFQSQKNVRQQRTFAINLGQVRNNQINRNIVANQPQLEKGHQISYNHQLSQNQNYKEKRTYNISIHKYESATNPIRYVGANHPVYNRVDNQNIPERVHYQEKKFQASHLVLTNQSRTPSHYFNNGSSFNNWLKK